MTTTNGPFYPIGNVTSLIEQLKEGTNPTLYQEQTFSYDSLNRLTGAWAAPAGTPNFTLPGYTTTYTYDPIGNLTSRTNEGQPTTYTYSPSQPHAVTSLSGNTTSSYTYDDNGNMTNRTEAGITYTQQFDVENRLTQVTVNNTTTKFYYDASGQRTLTEEPSGTLIYTPFPAYEEEIPGAAPESLPIHRVTFGLGQPIAIHVTNDSVASNNGTFYLHTDHLGSTSYLTKSTGGKVSGSDARYQPFGPYRTTPSQTITDTGYTGQKHNPALGLIYYNARYYAPALARFISPDTLIPAPTNPQTFNRYAYVLNNPTRFTDPTGHICYDPDTDAATPGNCNGGNTPVSPPTPSPAPSCEEVWCFQSPVPNFEPPFYIERGFVDLDNVEWGLQMFGNTKYAAGRGYEGYCGHHHCGLDYLANTGDPVYAGVHGKIVKINKGTDSSFGPWSIYVEVEVAGKTYTIIYGHINNILDFNNDGEPDVYEGMAVNPNTQIAEVGADKYGVVHLHVEITDWTYTYNIVSFMRPHLKADLVNHANYFKSHQINVSGVTFVDGGNFLNQPWRICRRAGPTIYTTCP